MDTADRPTPPDSLPNYLAEGVPKQDIETLEDLQEYVDDLLQYRAQDVPAEDLPETADPVDVEDTPGEGGTVVKEKVTCGDDTCACMSGGEKHGPYLYRYYYADGGMHSEYIGKP